MSNFGQIRLTMPVLMAARKNGRWGSGNVGGGEMGHQEKKQRVAWDMKIEVDQTMYQKSRAGNEAGEMESGRERFVLQE